MDDRPLEGQARVRIGDVIGIGAEQRSNRIPGLFCDHKGRRQLGPGRLIVGPASQHGSGGTPLSAGFGATRQRSSVARDRFFQNIHLINDPIKEVDLHGAFRQGRYQRQGNTGNTGLLPEEDQDFAGTDKSPGDRSQLPGKTQGAIRIEALSGCQAEGLRWTLGVGSSAHPGGVHGDNRFFIEADDRNLSGSDNRINPVGNRHLDLEVLALE